MGYSEKFKGKMVAKMVGPGARSAWALSKETDVGQSTLSRWLREAKMDDMSKRKTGKSTSGKKRRKRRTAEQKVQVVMEAASLPEAELGALLRREGLHEAELEGLREEVVNAATDGLRVRRRLKGETPEQRRIRHLEKELLRKEKALAEAAALLVLREKLRAFLAEDEEGDTDERSGR